MMMYVEMILRQCKIQEKIDYNMIIIGIGTYTGTFTTLCV